MILFPSVFPVILLLGVIALAILLAGVGLVWRAVQPRTIVRRQRRADGVREFRHETRGPRPGWELPAGIVLLLLALFGGTLVKHVLPAGDAASIASEEGGKQRITRPDGTMLQIQSVGPPDAPTLVLTHGWSLDRNEWHYLTEHLGDRFRLITWDLRGLGESTAPSNNDYALERMAEDLDAVIQTAAGKRPVVLVGHSIGGMINLTYCKLFPQRLDVQVVGIAQLNTTYTDPAKTTKNAEQQYHLQQMIGDPLLNTIAAFSPLVHVLNWLAYRSGALHAYIASDSFAGTEHRGDVEYAARAYAQASPAVVARGTLGMLHWDATSVLPKVTVPVLLITADQDTTTLPAASEHMQQSLPNAHLSMKKPAAHLGVLERNEEYDRAIDEFATAHLTANVLPTSSKLTR